ncbi:Uncharacterised protein [Neisseria meningitidis]|nr:Uncharacterised protein [Neisseria meningitidis]
MVSGEEAFRKPASPEGEAGFAEAVSSVPIWLFEGRLSEKSVSTVSGLFSAVWATDSGSGVSMTISTGLYGLKVSGSYTLSVDSMAFQSASARFWVSSSCVSAPDKMPFCAAARLSKSKSMRLEGVSVSTSNVCFADNSSSDSPSKASVSFTSFFGAGSGVAGVSTSAKVISMPSSAASSRSGSSSGTDSSVRRARLDWARRKSSSRAINAAPPPASSKVYEPPNRPSNSPLSVSSSAETCSTGSETALPVSSVGVSMAEAAASWGADSAAVSDAAVFAAGTGSGRTAGFSAFASGAATFASGFSTGFSTVACLDGSDGMDAVSALGFAVCGLGCSALILFRFGM